MTLLVRNEEELVAANLDYHLAQGVDAVIVTDNGSTDGTRAILAAYEARGAVQVIDDPDESQAQARQVTHMARLAATEHGADWVINNDADEFWIPQLGRLHDVFAAVPQRYGQVLARRSNFVVPPPGDGPFHRRMVVREARSLTPHGTRLEPKVAHRARADVRVATGNHHLEHPPLASAPIADLVEVFHFPVRSFAQFAQKVEQTGRAYAAPGTRRHNDDDGRDQRMLYDLQQRGQLQAWFDAHAPSPEAVAAGLRDGTLVLDRRLEHAMDRREPAPGADRARAIVAAALGFAERTEAIGAMETELAVLRDRVARLEAHLAADETLKGELRAYVEVLEERAVTLRDDRDAQRAALEALRNSALVRATRPLRRLYYRAR